MEHQPWTSKRTYPILHRNAIDFSVFMWAFTRKQLVNTPKTSHGYTCTFDFSVSILASAMNQLVNTSKTSYANYGLFCVFMLVSINREWASELTLNFTYEFFHAVIYSCSLFILRKEEAAPVCIACNAIITVRYLDWVYWFVGDWKEIFRREIFVFTLSERDSGQNFWFLARDWCVLQNMRCVKVMFVWSVFIELFKNFMWNVLQFV